MSENSNQQNNDMKRRELLKGLATVPVLGLFLVNLWQKIRRDTLKKSNKKNRRRRLLKAFQIVGT